MPRDGSGNYTLPYPAVVDGTTIESAVHNGTMSDIALQLNGPVPIIAGGTGANNALDARTALGAEVASQVVTNYDTHVFASGSFYSNPGATGEPVSGHYFSGVCIRISDAAILLEGRANEGPSERWTRRRWGGWEAWVKQSGSETDLDTRYVNVIGDSMSGPLTISARITASDAVFFNAVTAGQAGATATYAFGNTGTKYLNYDSAVFNMVGGPLYNYNKGNIFGTAAGAGMSTALAPTDSNILFYGSGANWAGMGTDSGGNWWLRTGLSGSPYPALMVYSGDQGVTATSWIGPSKQSGGYQTKMRFDSLNTSSYETNATQTNHMVRSSGNGFYWVKNDTGYEGGANQVTLAGLQSANSVFYAGGLSANGNLSSAINYSLDVASSPGFTVAAATNYLIVQNFSGLIIATSLTHGVTDVFACGAGSTFRLGGSVPGTPHSGCAYAPAQLGYVLSNLTGATSTFSVAVIRTKPSA